MTRAETFVQIIGSRVLLRDPLPEDVEARLRWSTVETDWQDWDAPWEGKGVTPPEQMEAARNSLREQIARSLPTPRTQLWVQVVGGPLLGWVNHYHYDPEARLAYAGINICESAYWSRGLGMEALRLWIGYLFSRLELDFIRAATWSGNTRMLRVAEKCGFELVKCDVGRREVLGETYDGLEFELTGAKWDVVEGGAQ
jgi:RimJ/RimL family protein N-acetyltransferase